MTLIPRLVLFDLDDTLCDYSRARHLRLNIAFSHDMKPDQVDHPRRDVARMVEDSLAIQPHGADHFPEVFARHGVMEKSVAEAAIRWYRENRFHGLELFADAVGTISALRQAAGEDPLIIGVVTNGPAEVQREKIDLLAIASLVDFTLVSGEFGYWKPDQRIFSEALRLGKAHAGEAVFIGDSIDHDIIGARAAGIRTIWMNRHGQHWPSNLPRPDGEIASLEELLPALTAR